MPSRLKLNALRPSLFGTALWFAVAAPAQSTPAPAPDAGWSLGSLGFTGILDGYYSYNANRPSNAANGQTNDLYNFNDKTDQFNLSEARLSISHAPSPVGVEVDLLAGRANVLIHSASDKGTDDYIEQAYVSVKPVHAHGTEIDFGQFVTSAGAEVIEAVNDWSYSRSLMFAWAIPYYHFGVRTSVPVTKEWTAGLQLVNGWNDVVANNGGVTVGLTSAYTRTMYTWDLNVYTGPQNADSQQGYRNLIDTTLLLTPTARFNAYLNYDYGQNRTPTSMAGGVTDPAASPHWQGGAVAAHEQTTNKTALTGRFEYFDDNQGYSTGTAQAVREFTGTYEYKWGHGLLMRAEYRRDWSTAAFFHRGNDGMVHAQSTFTVAVIASFGSGH